MRTERHGLPRLALVGVAVAGLWMAGCSDMKDQPHHEPLEKSTFFADGRSSRPLVEGTIPRGFLRDDDRIYRGIDADGKFVENIPIRVDQKLLERGRNRFDIYCSPCHGRRGDGLGMVVQRGYKQPPSYHIDRLRGVEDGYIYDVITNGFGQMASYAAQVLPMDRWAIVAYVRALQLSQYSDLSSVSGQIQSQVRAGKIVDTRPQPEESEEGHHGSGH